MTTVGRLLAVSALITALAVPMLWRKIGLCRVRQGEVKLAVKALERAASLAPSDAAVLNTYADVLLRAKQSEKAVEVAVKMVELAPEKADYWDTLGHAQKAKGDTAEARKAFRKALSINPDHPGGEGRPGELGRVVGAGRCGPDRVTTSAWCPARDPDR